MLKASTVSILLPMIFISSSVVAMQDEEPLLVRRAHSLQGHALATLATHADQPKDTLQQSALEEDLWRLSDALQQELRVVYRSKKPLEEYTDYPRRYDDGHDDIFDYQGLYSLTRDITSIAIADALLIFLDRERKTKPAGANSVLKQIISSTTSQKNTGLLRYFIVEKGFPVDVPLGDIFDHSAIQYASGYATSLEIIQLLLDNGASADRYTRHGQLPLGIARRVLTESKSPSDRSAARKIIALLEQHTSQELLAREQVFLDAAAQGNLDEVKKLFNTTYTGKPCNRYTRDKEGNTALMLASLHGQIEVVDYLWDNCNDLWGPVINNDGKTAYDLAKDADTKQIFLKKEEEKEEEDRRRRWEQTHPWGFYDEPSYYAGFGSDSESDLKFVESIAESAVLDPSKF